MSYPKAIDEFISSNLTLESSIMVNFPSSFVPNPIRARFLTISDPVAPEPITTQLIERGGFFVLYCRHNQSTEEVLA